MNLQKKTSVQLFYCKFCKILMRTFFTEQLLTTATQITAFLVLLWNTDTGLGLACKCKRHFIL